MKQSRITGAVSLMLAQAVVLFLGYGTHLIIGRLLGPGPYGVYGVVLSVLTIFGIFLNLGVPSAVSRFVAQDEKHAHSILKQALRIQTTIALLLAIITAAASPLIARLLNDTSLTPLLAFISIVIFLQAYYQIFVQFLSGAHHFNRQAALTSIYAVAKLAGSVGLLFIYQVFGAIAGFAVGGIVAAIIGWLWTRNVGGKETKKLPRKSFLSFAGTYVLILAGLQLLMSLDLFMVKALLQDDIQVGFYNAAVTLSRISYFLLQGLAFIILPSVSALTKPGASQIKAAQFIKDILRYLIALIVPSIALAAATSKQLIILFFSQEFIPAAPILTILMIGLGCLAFFLLLANIAAGADRARVALFITVSMIVVSGGLGYILIPQYGLIGAAWQTTIAALLGLIALASYTFRTFRIPLPIRTITNVFIATIVTVLPTYIWKVSPYILPLQYIVLLGVYVAVLFVLGEITESDRARIASIHPKLLWLKK